MRTHAPLVPALLGAAALAALATAGAATTPAVAAPQDADAKSDTIRYLEGGAEKTRSGVEIQSADWDSVSYKNGGGRTASIPGASVIELRYGDAPREYDQGWRAIAARNGKAAKDAFSACLDAQAAGVIERKWIDAGVQVGLGEAYLLLALNDDAAYAKATTAFESALAANAKSLMADRIFGGLAQAALCSDKPADATRHADALVSAGRTARRPLWEIKGLFLRADAARATGNDSGAGQAYQSAARIAAQQAASTKSDAAKARYGRLEHEAAAAAGWLLLDKAVKTRSSGDFDAARSYFQQLPQKLGNEPDVLAATENAMGVIALTNDDAYGALRHFQATEVKYFSAPSEVARSLYYQAQCWEKIGDAEMRAARARDLKELYPKSEWARKL